MRQSKFDTSVGQMAFPLLPRLRAHSLSPSSTFLSNTQTHTGVESLGGRRGLSRLLSCTSAQLSFDEFVCLPSVQDTPGKALEWRREHQAKRAADLKARVAAGDAGALAEEEARLEENRVRSPPQGRAGACACACVCVP